jgi:hypothetical protein
VIEKIGYPLRRIQPALVALLVVSTLHAQDKSEARRPIPSVLNSVLSYDDVGVLRLSKNGELVPEIKNTDPYDISQMSGSPVGAETGIALDFHNPELNGTVSYGTYQDKSRFPVIAFLPRPVEMRNGHALLDIKKTFDNSNDIYHFTENGKGVLGFRVMSAAGKDSLRGTCGLQRQGAIPGSADNHRRSSGQPARTYGFCDLFRDASTGEDLCDGRWKDLRR